MKRNLKTGRWLLDRINFARSASYGAIRKFDFWAEVINLTSESYRIKNRKSFFEPYHLIHKAAVNSSKH